MRKKNGWGMGMMLMLLGVLLGFALIALYYMSLLYRGF
jgi:hypothetical protein